MKHKINKKTEQLAALLQEDYQECYQQLLESIKDEDYTRSEINYFIRKSIHHMLKAQDHQESADEYAKHNKKKWAIDENKTYREHWHPHYLKMMQASDRVTYAGFLSMVAYSVTLIVITAVTKGALDSWLWILIPGLVTAALMLLKIMFAMRLKLHKLHVFGDIIMFALITAICYFSTIYFIIFLWVYEVAYMLYLQIHVVEEDI